uniref:Peptidase metallopeptidase domain-containing protein n=1 Tax=Haptolina ericina TaxID=156174 RepID=A0A7S3F7H3_9EUKA
MLLGFARFGRRGLHSHSWQSFQRAAGLPDNGEVTAETLTALRVSLHADYEGLSLLPGATPGGVVTWSIDVDTLPIQLKIDPVLQEFHNAFAPWSKATSINFVYVPLDPEGGLPDILLSFRNRTPGNEFAFDGPGGSLAAASLGALVFDASERWELSGTAHPHRQVLDWDEEYFALLPVAIHEIGHALGLDHSDGPNDVMSPYYDAKRVKLSENDIQRVQAVIGSV